ncbi:hypothetical protein ACHQM5_022975 [Ranunculus cassubicifolius]
MLCISPTVCSIKPQFKPSSSSPTIPHPPLLIRFNTSHRENIRYLKTLNLISPTTTKFTSPEKITQILSLINHLKSKSFSDSDIQKLANRFTNLMDLDYNDIDLVFNFLTLELPATVDESCKLILNCPGILLSGVEFCLKPSVNFLKELGLKKLNSPSVLNAHLLNTRVEKFEEKIRFLESLGFSNEEARRACGRLPAIFGYSIENNMRVKVDYLVEEMGRGIEELKAFPQFFAFSLDKRIVPRHLHLKERNVEVPLQKMLLWSDQKFYAKWK